MAMRNRDLHDALRAFALEAAALLRDAQDRGAEVEFELDEGNGRSGPALYHYRPLTGKFIADYWHRLRGLPTRAPAAEALGAGAAAYLRVNGLRGAEADPALRAMLERLYDDATDFSFPEERFERVYAEVERTLHERAQPATVVAAVHGLVLDCDRVELGGGLALVEGRGADAPDEALWGCPAGWDQDDGDASREPNVLVTLTRHIDPDTPLPVPEAHERFQRLLAGLRLWKRGGAALAAIGWRRSGEGTWRPFELESSGVPRGEPWVLEADEHDHLHDFLAAIGGARSTGAVAWSLARFQAGCGQRRDTDALTDYLLALRVLVGCGIDLSASDLALRVAVLCAEDRDRRRVQRQIELAQALERFVVGDGHGDDYVEAIGSESPERLVAEVERHLRALLRDVLCGYLDPDLHTLSDELLLEQSGRVQPEPTPPPEPADSGQTTEIEALDAEIESLESTEDEIDVTATDRSDDEPGQPALDYDWDDPAGYSAPV